MKYSENNKPLVCMQTNSTCYKGTSEMIVQGVLWHSTGANNPYIKRYVQPSDNAPDRKEMLDLLGKNDYGNDWNHIYLRAGVNAFIGKLADGTVATVQTMPWDYAPWGCGKGKYGSCNSGWIQFEICESNLSNKEYFDAVYKEACELTAYLCNMYNLDPSGYTTLNGVKVPVILCHADSHSLGLGSNHGDVLHWFEKYGKTMDDVRADVAALMNNTSSASIKVGDIVSVSINAKYYDNKSMPLWVKFKKWIVKSVSGDRVVIDRSLDGKHSICSPVNAKYLTVSKKHAKKSVEEIAREVIQGKWGTGETRRYKLTKAGYNYDEVQKVVNALLSENNTTPKKTVDEIAREVIQGKWGSGADRKNRLESAGYDYDEVQKRVNELLG